MSRRSSPFLASSIHRHSTVLPFHNSTRRGQAPQALRPAWVSHPHRAHTKLANPKEHRRLRAFHGRLDLPLRRAEEGSGLHVLTTLCVASPSGMSGEGADANKGSGVQRSGWLHRLGLARPVACLAHADLAPRRAVRRGGPRLVPTRSARTGEPCGPARPPGDRGRSSRQPYRGCISPCGGCGKKNSGSESPGSG